MKPDRAGGELLPSSFFESEGSRADSTVIVGSGIAGLAAAIRLKETQPDHEVIVLDKPVPQSNTLMAGQRFRAGIAGKRQDPEGEIASLLASRNDGQLTPDMVRFAAIATQALDSWQSRPDFVTTTDRPNWFGPQWGTAHPSGSGRGHSVVQWLKLQAAEKGVHLREASVHDLVMSDGHVEGLAIQRQHATPELLRASRFVLANGSITGLMYESTNKAITNSAHELAFRGGLSLADNTIHMIHPFGLSSKDGEARVGCFETDRLSEVNVYVGAPHSPQFDPETTQLLHEHQAHYHFPAIAERFRQAGSVVLLSFPDGIGRYARVSHHHSHTGIETTDGVSVTNMDNLYAVGDASGLGYWTNHRERFPGFALTKCLVDAELVTDAILRDSAASGGSDIAPFDDYLPPANVHRRVAKSIRSVNTRFSHQWLATPTNGTERAAIAQEWVATLQAMQSPETASTLFDISIATALAHERSVSAISSHVTKAPTTTPRAA